MPNLAGAKRPLLERADQAVDGGRDLVCRLPSIDQPELALLAVVVDQGRRLVEEDVDPVSNDIRAIIAALVALGAVHEPVEPALPVDLNVEYSNERPLHLGPQRVQRLVQPA